ncbi:MAG: hypothetical protein ACODAJ_08110, partial [Planctomycetota bacterium]
MAGCEQTGPVNHCVLLSLAVLLGCTRLLAPPGGKADFVVATDGDDANPGTRRRPFATLARARDAVRERIGAGLERD